MVLCEMCVFDGGHIVGVRDVGDGEGEGLNVVGSWLFKREESITAYFRDRRHWLIVYIRSSSLLDFIMVAVAILNPNNFDTFILQNKALVEVISKRRIEVSCHSGVTVGSCFVGAGLVR